MVMVVLAVISLSVGIWLSRNASRTAAARAELPPPADCRRFPGACAEGVPETPPAELADLAAEVRAADATWRATLERERRSGAFPEKGLTDLRDALAVTASAVADAHALVYEAEQAGNDAERQQALDAARSAYDAQLSLLRRATRLLEEAV